MKILILSLFLTTITLLGKAGVVSIEPSTDYIENTTQNITLEFGTEMDFKLFEVYGGLVSDKDWYKNYKTRGYNVVVEVKTQYRDGREASMIIGGDLKEINSKKFNIKLTHPLKEGDILSVYILPLHKRKTKFGHGYYPYLPDKKGGKIKTEFKKVYKVKAENQTVIHDVAVDKDNNIGITGYIRGVENNKPLSRDIFVAKYSQKGEKLWSRTIETDKNELGNGIAFDKKGSIFISGETYFVKKDKAKAVNPLSNDYRSRPYSDIVAAGWNSKGEQLWKMQYGGKYDDSSSSLVVDSYGRVVLAGRTHWNLEGQKMKGGKDQWMRAENDMFVTWIKGGKRVKTRLYGLPFGGNVKLGEDGAKDVATYNGNIYLTGTTHGRLGGQKLKGIQSSYVVKYNSKGKRVWTRLDGVDSDGYTITTDKKGVYFIAIRTRGKDNAIKSYTHSGKLRWSSNIKNIFLRKIISDGKKIYGVGIKDGYFTLMVFSNKDGKLLWSKNFKNVHVASGVALDSENNIVISGIYTKKTIEFKRVNADRGWKQKFSSPDGFLAKLNSKGEIIWEKKVSIKN